MNLCLRDTKENGSKTYFRCALYRLVCFIKVLLIFMYNAENFSKAKHKGKIWKVDSLHSLVQ